ncbi:ketosteroid isomerase-like protein [Novosphingobium sp. PhB165]|uniref:nuclear transport factor 2 family protein n=1 Tax=Novosphingobium sp. PhB165 TaxID=2485105 RepID=UPI001048E588|nr:nuclear transport factor 2 family protein [Novosphingobium sp. PhB165]TCM22277.1 ketosteroid isomerase-like protein [Novosphingobium sp. PhB165]
MAIDEKALRELLDKDAIRDLVLLYSRAIDRQDIALLRDLYTEDATDSHGDSFDGPAEDYCRFIEGSFPYMPYSGHHVCNHMIAVDAGGDTACGEVYALAWHLIPARDGSQEEDFMAVRYIDNYRRCADGKWRFSKRVVTYDFKLRRPFDGGGLLGQGAADPSYALCDHPLFARGART